MQVRFGSKNRIVDDISTVDSTLRIEIARYCLATVLWVLAIHATKRHLSYWIVKRDAKTVSLLSTKIIKVMLLYGDRVTNRYVKESFPRIQYDTKC